MKLSTIEKKITEITESKTPVLATYRIADNSVQAEMRLSAQYNLRYPVDSIHYPKNLEGKWDHPLWSQMRVIENEANRVAKLAEIKYRPLTLAASAKTKSGSAARAEAEAKFRADTAAEFLGAYRMATKKTVLARIRKNIEGLQAQQMELIPQMRKANSEYFAQRRGAKAQARQNEAAALESGKFWEASKEALKDYFHPPFDRNYLAAVSAKWRAALYTEMDSTAWKASKGDWRHKNVGTGRGYLCGIDDNGDEWGHIVNNLPLSADQYGDLGYADVTVEDAMSALFGIAVDKLGECQRQGDLLFCACRIAAETTQVWGEGEDGLSHIYNKPLNVELRPHDGPWEIRESHTVESTGLMRNGRYFASPNEINVTHTSHAAVTLPAGEYRLYELQLADAD